MTKLDEKAVEAAITASNVKEWHAFKRPDIRAAITAYLDALLEGKMTDLTPEREAGIRGLADTLDVRPSRSPNVAVAMRDLLSALDAARAENAQWRTWGIIEIAIRNPNVRSYIDEWEGRAERAEARIRELTEWRPMESAPKDGTRFLAQWGKYGVQVIHRHSWEDRPEYFEKAGSCWLPDAFVPANVDPTGWLPLPEARNGE